MSRLLDLPSEIRHQIWTLAFGWVEVTPEKPYNLYLAQCDPCDDEADHGDPAVELFSDCFKPLLTCKQIWNECQSVFFDTMHLHLANENVIERIVDHKPSGSRLLEKVHTLSVLVHINDSNRVAWRGTLAMILQACPSVRKITLHSHMRPPLSSETLLDAVFFAAAVIESDRHLLLLKPQEPDGINFKLLFEYIYEDIMFVTPLLGDIRCSDALEEHSAVIRDLIQDPAFQRGVRENDSQTMTARLVATARSYEQHWLERLQRKAEEGR